MVRVVVVRGAVVVGEGVAWRLKMLLRRPAEEEEEGAVGANGAGIPGVGFRIAHAEARVV